MRTRAADSGTGSYAASGRVALPADPATVDAFRTACPAGDSTQRRRLAAIEHYHRIAGQSVRTSRQIVLEREPIDPEQVELAMLMLPRHVAGGVDRLTSP